MLSLTGTIRAATVLPGRTDRKTGQVYPPRPTLQLEGKDSRGLVALFTLSVPDLAPFAGKEGSEISVPVRAWTTAGTVQLSYEAPL